MNLVKGFYYFTYLDILLLILFKMVDAYYFTISYKKIMNSIRPTSAENNVAQRTQWTFTWVYVNDPQGKYIRFHSSWNFVRNPYIFTF